MNAKERIITALRGRQPDAVPVTPGLSEMVPVRKSGLTYIEFFWRERRDFVRARCDTEKAFGADVFLHADVGPSPHDPEVTTEVVKDSADEVIYREVIHTPKGDLANLLRITPTESIAMFEGFVKDPATDRDKVLALLAHPEGKDAAPYVAAHRYVGDAGHCGYWLSTPVDWWSHLRGGPERMIFDLVDHPALMHDLFVAYTNYAVAFMADFLAKHAAITDSIGLDGSTTSMSVLSPAHLEKYTLPFVRAIKGVTAKFDVPIQYHMCGRSREAIPLLVQAGVDGMDALERPPTGNVDLAEVKRLFGRQISLSGNVHSIEVMLHGAPADVERDVIRCMDSAKEGGGFILTVGDQTPYHAPDDNIFALVEAGRKYGVYSKTGAPPPRMAS
ncbi:MAG: uroporphyrinogen decarboxylase family protein [Planctomycetota bacterium]